jgi:hypothetical protein
MADGQHKLSRRALLGAVCAAPLIRHPGLGSHQSSTLMGSLDPGSTFSSPLPQERWPPLSSQTKCNTSDRCCHVELPPALDPGTV